jgi:hypothetical protein
MASIRRLERNAAAILHAMAEAESVSQAQLMPQTHLKRTSIFNVMEQMKEVRLVRSCGDIPSGKGRNTIMWKICEDAGRFLVVYFGHLCNYYRVYDFQGNLLQAIDRTHSPTMEDAIAELRQVIEDLNHSPKSGRAPLRGIALSLAGIIDAAKGEVVLSYHWRLEHYPLAAQLTKLWDRSPPLILIENNVRLSTWGEKCAGLGRENRHFLLLSIHGASKEGPARAAIGLGSGIVLDGRLFAGRSGGAGELDHLFSHWLQTHYPTGNRPSSLTEMGEDQLRDFASDLGSNFSHIINYLAPEKLVVHFNEEPPSLVFVDALREALHANLSPPRNHDFPVEVSQRGVESLLDGGIHLLRQSYFAPSEHLMRQVHEALKRK